MKYHAGMKDTSWGEYAEQEDLHAMRIALDVAVMMEESGREWEKGDEILFMAREIDSLVRKGNGAGKGKKTVWARSLSGKVKVFVERCKELAAVEARNPEVNQSGMWREIQQESEAMAGMVKLTQRGKRGRLIHAKHA